MSLVSRSTVQRNRAEDGIRADLLALDIDSQIRAIEDDLEDLHIGDAPQDYEHRCTEVASSPASLVIPWDQPLDEANVRSFTADLSHIRAALLHNGLAFTLSGRSLRFVETPSTAGPYERYVPGSESGYNFGRCALHPDDASNRQFLAYHTWLIVTYESFPPLPQGLTSDVSDSWHNLSDQVREEMDRLEDMKEIEWEVQQQSPSVRAVDSEGFRDIDTSTPAVSSLGSSY